jgi:transmembrane sensor
MKPEGGYFEKTGTSGTDADALAAAWVERKDRETWSDAEQAEFQTWLMASPANRAAFWRLETAWRDTDRLTAFHPASPSASVAARPPQFLPRILGAAIVVLTVIVFGAGVGEYLLSQRTQLFETAVGARRTLFLADGSRVELNTNSEVHVFRNGNRREIVLDKGEAYFEVKHDAVRPFIVMAGNGRVTDLGTKFVVRREGEALRIAVSDGRVRYDEGRSAHRGAVLNAGDIAIVDSRSISIVRNHPVDISNDFAWRRGALVFDNATLADVADEFNRYNSTKLVIADKEAQHIQIAGTFHANNLDAFVQTVRRVLMLHVEKRGSVIAISR